MTFHGKFAIGPVAALVLSLGTVALAGGTPRPIHIHCEDARLQPLCDGLRAALAEMPAGRDVTVSDAPAGNMLTVRFVVSKHSEHVLAGHLVWVRRDGTSGDGPVLELAVVDAPLNAELLRDFGRQLALHSDIPL